MEDKKIKISNLRKVKSIGNKTIQRIKEQFDESEYVSEYKPDMYVEPNSLVNGDMLEVMNGIPDRSIDMILTDLPYGTTACSWDAIIPFEKLWKQYNRIIKDDGAIVLFGSEPFSSQLRNSNIDNYKYDWIWCKNRPSNVMLSKKQPLKYHENISVFYKNQVNYKPQMEKSDYDSRERVGIIYDVEEGVTSKSKSYVSEGHSPKLKYPKSYMFFKRNWRPQDQLHSSQKPVDLLEYLIRTYTVENDIVLDSTMGSGSTCVAAKNLGRRYIGIELDKEYFEIAKDRVEGAK